MGEMHVKYVESKNNPDTWNLLQKYKETSRQEVTRFTSTEKTPTLCSDKTNENAFGKFPKWMTKSRWQPLDVCQTEKEKDFSSCHV